VGQNEYAVLHFKIMYYLYTV